MRTVQIPLEIITFNPLEEAKKQLRLHRYEQQMLFDFCLEYIKLCADDEYRYDERNYEAHKKAVDMSTAYLEYTGQEL